MDRVGIVGVGRVGSFVAYYLRGRGYDLRLLDVSERVRDLAGKLGVEYRVVDALSINDLRTALSGVDVVVTAVPGSVGHEVVKNVVSLGYNVVDVSFFPEDPGDIDELARRNKVLAVLDCGIGPGLTNLLVGRAYEKLGGLTEYRIYIGGISEVYDPPFGVVLGFNPLDFIDEYRRPARYIENGEVRVVDPLSGPTGRVFIEGVGELEFFHTDGLRSLIRSFPNVKFAAEYTLRWPGHVEFMRGLKKLGLLSHERLGCGVYADECLASAIASAAARSGMRDMTVLRVDACKDANCLVYTQVVKATSEWRAMERATGSFLSYVTIELLQGRVKMDHGVVYPEKLAYLSDDILSMYEKDGMPISEKYAVVGRE
ncbi:MAG: saccharopine dehydrogenase C-terminal domain-containing protein [Vulcanisaeta sp.]